MAHFAELESKTDPTGFTSDTHLVVKRVVVVGNDCVTSDEHADGESWCVNFFGGGTWKQTSYNDNFRKQFAGIGFTYDAAKNKFISQKPYTSWSLDSNDDWQSPVPVPTVTEIGGLPVYTSWDEPNLQWLGQTVNFDTDPATTTNYTWDASNLAWDAV